MKKIIIGNWKMNPSSLEETKKIIRKTRACVHTLKSTEVVACPPFVYIPAGFSKKNPENFKLGAQTVSSELGGPHTGEVSISMLKDLGVQYVIVGHSEERARGNTDDIVSKKIKAVVEAGMYAVLCVGEKIRDEAGLYLNTLKEQIQNSLANIPQNKAKNIIIAYEPIWAIGATESMKPEQVYEMSLFVKKVFSDVFSQDQAMKINVLYGGSVNFRNASEIIKISQVDGLLVGRESVNMPGFIELLKAVDLI